MTQEQQLTTERAAEGPRHVATFSDPPLDAGEIEYHLAGKHRRIALRDVSRMRSAARPAAPGGGDAPLVAQLNRRGGFQPVSGKARGVATGPGRDDREGFEES
jgi:hypothetical protein